MNGFIFQLIKQGQYILKKLKVLLFVDYYILLYCLSSIPSEMTFSPMINLDDQIKDFFIY